MDILTQLLERFEKQLQSFLADWERHVSGLEDTPGLKTQLVSYIQTGGKRLRPLLFLLAHTGLGGKSNQEIDKLAVALELMHNFALIHDDIIDKSEQRRGRPSLQVRYEEIVKGAKGLEINGADFALMAGDALYNVALCTIKSLELPGDGRQEVLSVILDTALKTSLGQYMEMELSLGPLQAGREQILRVYELKTAYYTFVCPLVLGAILTRCADQDARETLSALGLVLGKAYQIKDDLEDFLPISPTVVANRITIPHWRLFQKASPSEKKLMERVFATTPAEEKDLVLVKEMFEKHDVARLCRDEIEKNLEASEVLLREIPLSPASKNGMLKMINRLFGQS